MALLGSSRRRMGAWRKKARAWRAVAAGSAATLERYSKRFVSLQLQRGNVSDARDELKKMIAYGEGCFYLALFNRLDEAMLSGYLSKTCE